MTERFLASVRAVVESLAAIPGRKALVLFTSAYAESLESPSGIDSVVAACNRANVAVYAVPSTLAEMILSRTGGLRLPVSDELPAALAAIAREQEEYYQVGYVPPDSREGSCHSLRVRVNVSGAVVRTRQQYCTEQPQDLVAGRIAGAALEDKAAADTAAGAPAGSLQLPFFYSGPNRASVRVVLDLVPSGMKFRKENGRLRGELQLIGAALRPDGGTAARFTGLIAASVDTQQQADAFLKTPYHYQNQFTVAAGEYTFRLLFGAGDSLLGKIESPLVVEPLTAGGFGAGGIVLTNDIRPAPPLQPGLGSPALDGVVPLIADGMQFAPLAEPRLRHSDRNYFYTEVYDPALAGADPPAITIRYRILDRGSGAVRYQTGAIDAGNYVISGTPVVPIASALPLASLPPGAYRLEITTGHSSGPETAVRNADFDLLP